jgi:NAD(P) transhydrogenase subunit alpha
MIVGIPRESCPGERRVAVVPAVVASLRQAGLEVMLEHGAGEAAGFPDDLYAQQGATFADRPAMFERADILLMVRTPSANPQRGRADLDLMRRGQTLIGFADPLGEVQRVAEVAARGLTLFALELIPRITRAQSMDALSSMATVAGYKAVLLAAAMLPRLFPMLMTAAGTITPARVFVVGAGVAGLQAIATARRLGARVEAYDVRPAVKEQVESLGARFVELPLDTRDAEDRAGYARAFDEEFYRRQRETMARVVASSDVVITTAVVPGQRAPLLITTEMVEAMAPGSIIVDMAAERGGNCELTRAEETVVHRGVTILGPTNLAATVPYHASQMYAKNITTFLLHLLKRGTLAIDRDDEITRETLVAQHGEVVHPRVREKLGLLARTGA